MFGNEVKKTICKAVNCHKFRNNICQKTEHSGALVTFNGETVLSTSFR